MKIHLHCVFWNEEKMIPFFLDHYVPLCDKIILHDNCSTDRSVELLRREPKVEVHNWSPTAPTIILAGASKKSQMWHSSGGVADWVIIADMDELVYHPNLRGYLEGLGQDITAVKTTGYHMVHDCFPLYNGEAIHKTVRRGAREPYYDKVSLFRPDRFWVAHHDIGGHAVEFHPPAVYPEVSEVKLLHYRFLGREETYQRNQELGKLLRPHDIAMRWGAYYRCSREYFDQAYDRVLHNAEEVL